MIYRLNKSVGHTFCRATGICLAASMMTAMFTLCCGTRSGGVSFTADSTAKISSPSGFTVNEITRYMPGPLNESLFEQVFPGAGIDTAEKFSEKIKEQIAVLNTNNNGWTREVNLVTWNGGRPKIDIREWSPDHARMGKGVTLTEEEVEKLKAILNGEEIEDDIDESNFV